MNGIRTTTAFDQWLESLSGDRAQTKVLARISNMGTGNFGACEPVGDGISESKIDYGPGYRIYFKRVGKVVYLLLIGGDKSTQTKDIKQAKALAAALQPLSLERRL
jgi:putative addiction module killer protein